MRKPRASTSRQGAPLLRNHRGAAIMEFAILAPALLMVLMGLMDITYQAYFRAVLEGAMQKAGRDSGIEAASNSAIDEQVRKSAKQVAGNAVITFDRKSYTSFSVVKPERFTDSNKNGIRDPGECYDDVNGNKQWDADPGKSGQGGASDVTLYTATATYKRLFPLGALLGWSSEINVTSTTLLKNQPYASQASPNILTICSP